MYSTSFLRVLRGFIILTFLVLASCADMFQPKIPLPVNDNPGSLGDVFRKEETITQLDVPTQFYVAPYYSSSEIRLTWGAVRGAAYYMVERAVAAPGTEPDDGEYEPLDRFVYGTSYVDKILETPTLDSLEFQDEYFYRVSAFNTAQKYDESEPTVPQSAMLFRAPAGLRASGGESVEDITLQWERAEGAVSYEIWRSTLASGNSASLLAEVRGNHTWYRNMVSQAEQGVDYYYMITARNAFGNKTPQTRPAYGYARVFGAPDAPAHVRLAENSGRGHSTTEIKIEWDAVDDAGYYAVYRYSEIDSSLTRLTGNTGTTATELIDSGLRSGIYYYYKVQAITEDIDSGKELKSQFSSPDPEGFLLSSPEEVIAEKNSNGTVIIKWKPAKGSEGDRLQYTYNVYAGNTPDGDLLPPPVVTSVSPGTGTDGYISTAELNVGNLAFFRVSTVNRDGLESSQSIVVSPSPAAAIIQSASQYASIAGDANSNGVYPVRITWKKPENETPAFYHVQRSTRADGGFTRINEVPLRENGEGTDGYSLVDGVYSFIDRNEAARVGRKYYYRVLSLNRLEQGSFPSDVRIGWGALTHTQYMLEYNKTMNSALKKLTYMHKPGSTDKLGTETKYGGIGGSIYYNAAISGLGARIIIQLTNYADFYIENVPDNGVYFTLSGNSNTTAGMDSSGSMDGTVTCTGMYPGRVYYDKIQIKGGAAGGGTYGVHPDGGFDRVEVPYTVLN